VKSAENIMPIPRASRKRWPEREPHKERPRRAKLPNKQREGRHSLAWLLTRSGRQPCDFDPPRVAPAICQEQGRKSSDKLGIVVFREAGVTPRNDRTSAP